ncbi:MAG TPA: peptidylprolyl isomerase [Smithella sp.]|nr:peptidylprolyl isomerase [Smithella sp.]MDM7988235.1 peptidylprolyl isomerase [Smithella sp.]HNY50228.1 peptidylprolyl isomerase [Smithella sp.]HOG89856.1 peptidylprolyl isomerase [Smithella sp.]HQI73041.1 peptidylprolyl isomerase [Smithella sp.]
MKYKKHILFFLMVMLVSMPVRAEVVDRIAAVVNDEIITLSELNAAFAPYEKNIENTYKGKDKDSVIRQTREAFFQRMIDGILIEQEAKKAGISVKDEDVMNVIQGMITKQKISMDELMKNLAREGSSLETVKKEIRSQIIRMKLLKKEVRDKIIITDDEIGEYYNKHRHEYEGKESVRIKQLLLLLPVTASPDEKRKLKNEALRLRERIIKGESFDALTAQYSQGPAALQGGDVGFIEKGTIIPEVETVAFSLPPEQISDVIESSMGFHIIKVIDKKGAGLKPIAVVREEIQDRIENEKLEKKYEEWISSVREKAHIETRL